MFNFFGRSSGMSMAQAVEEAKNNPGLRLVDVRSREEYALGHLPGAVNLPLDELEKAQRLFPDKSARLCLYCHSGARSGAALGALKRMGYTQCENIGGIAGYRGSLER